MSPLGDEVHRALLAEPTVDITTTGRQSGRPRRIEIWITGLDGRWFVTGTSGRRDWLANLRADPRLVVHVKHGATADLPAVAVEVTDPELRRRVFQQPTEEAAWYRSQQALDGLVRHAPMVELHFDQVGS